ncbi:MAG: hypothetical protein KKD59_01480 [Acidobacteria bacterium]|nr:hypothetical protein [Acidobacteriota bacterium]
MKRTCIIAYLLLLTLIGCNQQKSAWKGSTENVDGVTIVKNPKKPIYGPEKIQLQEILTIGKEEGDENTMFWGSLLVRTDDELNIYISDSMAKRLPKLCSKAQARIERSEEDQCP